MSKNVLFYTLLVKLLIPRF